MGVIIPNKVASKNITIPIINRNTQAKYIKYRHLNLLQNVITSAPTMPRTERPIIVPNNALIAIVMYPNTESAVENAEYIVSSKSTRVLTKLSTVSFCSPTDDV